MNLKKRYLVPRTAIPANSYTFRVDMPAVGALSALEVIVEAKNDTAGNAVTTIADAIVAIQLIADGSRPLLNLDGWDAAKISAYYNYGQHTFVWDQRPNVYQTFKVLIPFGRYLGDVFYWLRLQDYASLYLDIIFNFLTGSGMFSNDPKYLTVIGYFIEPTPSTRIGLFKHTLFNVFRTEGSGDKLIKLPQGNLIPYVFVRAQLSWPKFDDVLTWVKLDVNDGAEVLLEGRPHEIAMDNFYRDGVKGKFEIVAYRTDNELINTNFDDIKSISVTLQHEYVASQNVPIYAIKNVNAGQVAFSGVLVSGTSTYAAAALDTTKRVIRLVVEQFGVGSMIKLQPGLSLEQEDFIDTTKYGNVRLIFTQATANILIRVITVEAVTK